MTVGERIKSRLLEQNKDMRWLHARTGVPLSTLYEIRNGRLKNSTQLAVIAHALGLHALWLQRGQGPKTVGTTSAGRAEDTWPFTWAFARLDCLPDADRRMVEAIFLATLEAVESRVTPAVAGSASAGGTSIA